jgi:hypothetical protein
MTTIRSHGTAGRDNIKNVLGQIPFTAELYWLVRHKGKPLQSRFSLKHLQAAMPELVAEAAALRSTQHAQPAKNIFIFATLHYWIEHAALLSLTMAAQGHKVTLGFLPYAEWQSPINRFDLRRQNVYARKVLEQMEPLVDVVSFLSVKQSYKPLPDAVTAAVEQVSVYDTQYTLQVEDVNPESDVYRLRLERNQQAARMAMSWFQSHKPDVVIVPNGTVQELGIVYRVARHLNIQTVTYEFGDQRQRIWLAQNTEVMRQETDSLWNARQNTPLTQPQMERLQSLFVARQRASMWENFARLWQDTPAKGGDTARAALGLDDRPVVMLATNVLGDSLTLGRQIFSSSMAEWITRTVQYFTGRLDVQLVIRVHPGEILTHGLSMVDVVKSVLPTLPEHIRLIKPDDKLNTYDVIEVADLGLVYTTTVGLEMALMGLPVVVTGKTHYRDRGFTYDPDTWVSYYKLLGQMLENPSGYRLSREQVEQAWHYAYRFFFEFPRPFPWHLVRMWEDYKTRPLHAVMGPECNGQYEATLKYLAGEPLDWNSVID